MWARATTFEGVNHELRPWLRMTYPRGLPRELSLEQVRPGRSLGRSWVLLLGVVPIDFDQVTLVEVGPGMRLLERSPMASMRVWEHERRVQDQGERSCVVTDRLTFEPRVRVAEHLAKGIVERVFRHRHRRLAEWWARAG